MKTIINNLMASILLIIHFACVEKEESKSTMVSPKKSAIVDSSLTEETKTRTKEIVKTNQMERNKNLIEAKPPSPYSKASYTIKAKRINNMNTKPILLATCCCATQSSRK